MPTAPPGHPMFVLCRRGEAIRGCMHGSTERSDFSIHYIGRMHGIRPLFFVFIPWVIDLPCSILVITASEKGAAGANCPAPSALLLLLAAIKETGSGSTRQERRVATGRETVRL